MVDYNANVDTITQFGPAFQSKVIASLIRNGSFLAQSMDVVNPNFFESQASHWIVGKILDYYMEYRTNPTIEYFRAEFGEIEKNETLKVEVLDQLKNSKMHFNDTDLEYVQDKFLEFCKNQTLKSAILRSADLLQRGQYGEIKVMIDSAMKAGTQKDVGLRWDEDFEQRHIEAARDTLTTGWSIIDKYLDGGLGPGELGVIAAPSGIGKSWALTHLGKAALKQGKSVIHYTYELNENYQGIRYDTSFTGIEPSSLKHHLETVKSVIETVEGRLFIKYFPTRTASYHTLLSHIDYLSIHNFRPDLIIIDYADLMRTPTKSNARHEELGYIYEELRSMAGELQVPIWTASQTQRSSINDEVIEADKIGESYNKVKTADVLLSLSRKTEDKINNTARLHIVKNRFGADGVTLPVKMDTSKGLVDVHDPTSPEGGELQETMAKGEENMKKYLANKLKSFQSDDD
jgi:replicative DNA helicase